MSVHKQWYAAFSGTLTLKTSWDAAVLFITDWSALTSYLASATLPWATKHQQKDCDVVITVIGHRVLCNTGSLHYVMWVSQFPVWQMWHCWEDKWLDSFLLVFLSSPHEKCSFLSPFVPHSPLFFILIETESHYEVQTGLTPELLLPQLPECWTYRHVPPGRLRQEDHEFEASLSYVVSSCL
jgi:hypothetical protein